MPLTEIQIDALVTAMPFKHRGRWQELADRLQVQTEEDDATTYARLLKWAPINLKQLQYILSTPDEVLFVSFNKRLAGLSVLNSNEVLLYTAPNNKITAIKQLVVIAPLDAAAVISIFLTLIGAVKSANDAIPPTGKTLGIGSTLILNTAIKLAPGDFLTVRSSVPNTVFSIYGIV